MLQRVPDRAPSRDSRRGSQDGSNRRKEQLWRQVLHPRHGAGRMYYRRGDRLRHRFAGASGLRSGPGLSKDLFFRSAAALSHEADRGAGRGTLPARHLGGSGGLDRRRVEADHRRVWSGFPLCQLRSGRQRRHSARYAGQTAFEHGRRIPGVLWLLQLCLRPICHAIYLRRRFQRQQRGRPGQYKAADPLGP